VDRNHALLQRTGDTDPYFVMYTMEEKLDGENWLTWKFQMKHFLLAKGLWEYIVDTTVLANARAIAEFNQKSQKVFSTIVFSY